MDNINFVIEEAYDLEGVKFKAYDVSVYLNDVKMPHTIFNASEVLPISMYKKVEFDLFTCSCGVAGCAGFQSPIVQSLKEGIVMWNFPESNDYTTDKKSYSFEEKQFKETFANLTSNMYKLEKNKIYHTTMVRDESMYGYNENEVENKISYKAETKLKEETKWYHNRYKGKQNFQEMMDKNYPELMKMKFKYTYDGVEGKNFYELSDIVCRLLNHYPSKDKEVVFLRNAQLAVKAILNFMNGDILDFKKIAHSSYEKHEMSSQSLIEWDFNDIKEENFNFEKLGLFAV